jgi:stage II sporulation protein AA (anti-sigma F factor antagonist)
VERFLFFAHSFYQPTEDPYMAHVTFSSADDTLYAYLVGEIDHDAAQTLRLHIDNALITRCPKTLVLDFSGVGFMDSSGVGLILGRQKCIAALGGTLRIQHAPAGLQRVLSLARLHTAAPPQ